MSRRSSRTTAGRAAFDIERPAIPHRLQLLTSCHTRARRRRSRSSDFDVVNVGVDPAQLNRRAPATVEGTSPQVDAVRTHLGDAADSRERFARSGQLRQSRSSPCVGQALRVEWVAWTAACPKTCDRCSTAPDTRCTSRPSFGRRHALPHRGKHCESADVIAREVRLADPGRRRARHAGTGAYGLALAKTTTERAAPRWC